MPSPDRLLPLALQLAMRSAKSHALLTEKFYNVNRDAYAILARRGHCFSAVQSAECATDAHRRRATACGTSGLAPNVAPASGPNYSTYTSYIAATAATVVASTVLSSCDTQPAPSDPATAVARLWSAAIDDIQRADAHLPPGVQITELQQPSVAARPHGACTVTLPVREGVDLRALERAVTGLPDTGGGAEADGRSSYFSSSKIAVRSTGEGREVIVSHGSGREVRLEIPSAYSRRPPAVTLSKSAGLTAADLALLSQLMAMTNDLQLHKRAHTRAYSPFSLADPFGFGNGRSDDGVGRFPGMAPEMADIMEGFLGLLMRDLERGQLDGADGGFGAGGSAGGPLPPAHTERRHSNGATEMPDSRGAAPDRLQAQAAQLEQLGARVYLPEAAGGLSWEQMAGYDAVKGLIEDIVLLSVTDSEVYEGIAKRTRRDGRAQRPKAVLFEGPPGTGKTTSARIIAKQAAVPLVYIPLESIVSKWYGESERNLSQMLALAESMGGCIIFLDEVDSLATSREEGLFEGTRRVLGTLLRFIDGFEATRSIVVAATNRKQDLDAALLSRCDAVIRFDLPDRRCRAQILQHYAAHLPQPDLEALAGETDGMSARDLRSICEVAERRWVSAIIKGKQQSDSLPPLEAYIASAKARRQSMVSDGWQQSHFREQLLRSLGRDEAQTDAGGSG